MIGRTCLALGVGSLACLLAVGIGLLTVSGCRTNPATDTSEFLLLSREQEAQIGADAAPQFTQEYGGAVSDDALQSYVTDIGLRLAAETEAYFPEIDWEFTLLDSDVVNAFALPGGKIFVTRGLAGRMTNEAQLAGVVGHEIGHVTAQHGNRRISRQMGMDAVLTGAQIFVDSASRGSATRQIGGAAVPALDMGGQLVMLQYGRDEEIEADRLGIRYMTRVGYNPRGQLQVMELLASLSGDARQPEFLSTHPYPETRIEMIRRLLDTKYADVVNDPAYGFYESRFQRRFLDQLAVHDRGIHRYGTLPPGHLAWCAHCAGRPIPTDLVTR